MKEEGFKKRKKERKKKYMKEEIIHFLPKLF